MSRSAGDSVVASWPPIWIVPASGRSSPAISRSVVVLPAPVGPSSTTNSPSAMCRSRPSTATVSPKALADALDVHVSHAAPPVDGVTVRTARPDPLSNSDSRAPFSARPTWFAGREPDFGRHPRLDDAVGRLHRDDLRRAEIFGAVDGAAQLGGVVEADMLGPDAERHVGRRDILAHFRHGDLGALDDDLLRALRQPAVEAQKIHRRRADEVGDEHGCRAVVDFARRAELLDDAVVHHRDLVGHRHRFHLVVRDVDGGGVDAVVQLAQLMDHQVAELGVERAERLVHQEAFRPPHDGAAERHALAVAAGKARDRFVEQMVDAQELCRLLDPAADLGRRHALRQAAGSRCSCAHSCADRARTAGRRRRCRARGRAAW